MRCQHVVPDQIEVAAGLTKFMIDDKQMMLTSMCGQSDIQE